MALETVTCLCKPEITMQEPAIAQAFDMKQPSFSEENVVEEPAPAEEAARERLSHQETVVPSSLPSSPRLRESSFSTKLLLSIEFLHADTTHCQQ